MFKKSLVSVRQLHSLPVRSFASGTNLEKFDFMDPLKLSMKLTNEELMIEQSAKQYA